MRGRLIDQIERSLRPRVTVIGRAVPRTTLAERMTELRVPAVSLAVLERDGAVQAKAWGAEPHTLFQAASISKPVTAMAVVRLAADGLFDLDQEVNELLRTWRLPEGEGVTVRRVLSHTAGLSVHGFEGYAPGADIPSVVQILDGVAPANSDPVRVVRPPGEAWQYSGGGYTLLQPLLEDVTGEPFTDLMRRVVLDPLGMRASTYEQPLPAGKAASAARGHDVEGRVLEGGWYVYPELAAASLWTNPRELLRVAEEMLRPGRVLDESIRDEMLTPSIDERHGLSWALEKPWFQHGGSNFGYHCLLFASVDHAQAAAVMTNGDGGGWLDGEIVATVADVFGWPDFHKERSAITLDDPALDAICGEYELEPEGVLSVRREGDRLLLSGTGVPERELYAASPNELYRLDIDAEIRWSGDSLTLDFAGTTVTAHRGI